MELPHLGEHCTKSDCKRLDFLPIRCDACKSLFCHEHYSYDGHGCPKAYQKNNQVPVCPLCNVPIPVPPGNSPDSVVGAHIDNDCASDPATSRRKVFTNKCTYRRCKTKEVIPVICNECSLNFCLKHRHPTDHECEGKGARKRWIFEAQQTIPSMVEYVQGSISEDEALARALALSMEEPRQNNRIANESDLDLARRLQRMESQATTTPLRNSYRDRCNLS